jgi:hypothetical protein
MKTNRTFDAQDMFNLSPIERAVMLNEHKNNIKIAEAMFAQRGQITTSLRFALAEMGIQDVELHFGYPTLTNSQRAVMQVYGK